MIPQSVMRWRAIVKQNKASQISESLTLAVIWKESTGDQWAYNPEPRYRWLWDVRRQMPFRAATAQELSSMTPPKDWPCLAGDPDQEWWAQMASWGLMQPMGAVARERSFRGNYLTQLVDPHLNIRIGTSHLWSYGFRRGQYDKREALRRYNGTYEYADNVIEKEAEIEAQLATV